MPLVPRAFHRRPTSLTSPTNEQSKLLGVLLLLSGTPKKPCARLCWRRRGSTGGEGRLLAGASVRPLCLHGAREGSADPVACRGGSTACSGPASARAACLTASREAEEVTLRHYYREKRDSNGSWAVGAARAYAPSGGGGSGGQGEESGLRSWPARCGELGPARESRPGPGCGSLLRSAGSCEQRRQGPLLSARRLSAPSPRNSQP